MMRLLKIVILVGKALSMDVKDGIIALTNSFFSLAACKTLVELHSGVSGGIGYLVNEQLNAHLAIMIIIQCGKRRGSFFLNYSK